MDWPLLAACAVVLSVERACYVWIARAPQSFRRWCARCVATSREEPIVVVRGLFCAFKAVQLALFVGWCYAYGHGSLSLADRGAVPVAVGAALILVGQALNLSVFYRLRTVGVFFGDRFGYAVPWCRAFPFSVIATRSTSEPCCRSGASSSPCGSLTTTGCSCRRSRPSCTPRARISRIAAARVRAAPLLLLGHRCFTNRTCLTACHRRACSRANQIWSTRDGSRST